MPFCTFCSGSLRLEGTLAAPVTPPTVTNWGSCPAGTSCVVSIPFNGNQAATNSSPFYDYSNDALYVGDNNGVLHKFTPVLSGTPAEVIGSGWPLTVHAATILSSPVLDPGSSRIFIGDAGGRVSYITNPTSGTAAVGGFVSLTGSIVEHPDHRQLHRKSVRVQRHRYDQQRKRVPVQHVVGITGHG